MTEEEGTAGRGAGARGAALLLEQLGELLEIVHECQRVAVRVAVIVLDGTG